MSSSSLSNEDWAEDDDDEGYAYEAYRQARGAYDQMWEQWQGNDDYPPAGGVEAAKTLEEAYMDWQEHLGRGRTLEGLWHTGL